MAAKNTKQDIREGFHRELQKHVEMLKLEFDKVERAVIHAYRMECDNREVKVLQDLKDAKMRLLRIKYNQEADLIVREFKNKVEDVLSRDGGGYSSHTDVGESVTTAAGKESGNRKRRKEHTEEKDVNQVSRNADNRALTRRTSRTRTETRSRKHDDYDQHQSSDAEQAANVERTARFLKSLTKELKETAYHDRGENNGAHAEKPDPPERRLGKLIIKPGTKKLVLVRDVEGPSADHAGQNRVSQNNAGRSKIMKESNKVEQEREVQEAPKQTVKRRTKGKQLSDDGKTHRKVKIIIDNDKALPVAARARSSEKDGGQSNAFGEGEINERTIKAGKARSGGDQEKDSHEASKRKRRRKCADNAVADQTKEQGRPSKKRKVKSGDNTKVRAPEQVEASPSQGPCGEPNARVNEGDEAGPDEGLNSEFRAGQGEEVQEVPVANVRRSKRQKKPTPKVKESKLSSSPRPQ